MQTIKALKAAAVWSCVFCASCILSTVCFAVDECYDVKVLFVIGVITVYGWMVNPFAIISCFRSLKIYLAERKKPDCKQMIGRKWVWIIVFPIITTVFWLLGGLLFIKFTGGV